MNIPKFSLSTLDPEPNGMQCSRSSNLSIHSLFWFELCSNWYRDAWQNPCPWENQVFCVLQPQEGPLNMVIMRKWDMDGVSHELQRFEIYLICKILHLNLNNGFTSNQTIIYKYINNIWGYKIDMSIQLCNKWKN